MSPQQQMRAITLCSGAVAGAAVGLLIYAFWPQPMRLALQVKAPVQQPVFVESPAPRTADSGALAAAALPSPTPQTEALAPPPRTAAASPAPQPAALALTATATASASAPAPAVTALTEALSAGPSRGVEVVAAPPTQTDPRARALLADGVALLAEGEIAAARLLLEQAAATGEARAWVALGDSYDPAALARLGALGVKGDAAFAKDCYAKAMSAGLSEARGRIAQLATQ